MTFLPIVERELRVSSRKRATYWARFAMALVVLIVFLWMVGHARNQGRTVVGHDLFSTLTLIAFAYALLVGVFFTADCLSSEKREGTLGLLFLTDLRSYDVVAGKVFATSIITFYALFAVFPIIGLPLLIGGVTGAEFGRMVLVLCATALFSLAVGTLVSALNSEEWQAMASAFLGLLLVTGGLPGIWATFFARLNDSWLDPLFLHPSPAYTLSLAFESTYSSAGGAQNFWSSMSVVLALTFACFVAACCVLPRSWRNSARQRTKKADRYSAPSRRTALLEENPFLWLCLRLRGRFTWLAIAGMAGLAFWSFFFLKALARKNLGSRFVICVLGAFILFAIFKFVVVFIACRRLHTDHRSGALELILSTPLSVEEVLHGQEKSLWRLFRIPLGVLSAMNLLLLAHGIWVERSEKFTVMFSILTIGGIVTLFTDFQFIVRHGMLQGMLRRKLNVAVLLTIGLVLILPWLAVFLGCLLLASSSGASEDVMIGLGIVYFTTCTMAGLMGAEAAKERLSQSLRALAAGVGREVENSFSSRGLSAQNSTTT